MIWQTVVHLYSRRLFFEKVQWDITTWKKNMQEFRMLLLSERNQSDNVIYMVIATIWYSEEGKTEEAIYIIWRYRDQRVVCHMKNKM